MTKNEMQNVKPFQANEAGKIETLRSLSLKRSENDRRKFSYAAYYPERRSGNDRRKARPAII